MWWHNQKYNTSTEEIRSRKAPVSLWQTPLQLCGTQSGRQKKGHDGRGDTCRIIAPVLPGESKDK